VAQKNKRDLSGKRTSVIVEEKGNDSTGLTKAQRVGGNCSKRREGRGEPLDRDVGVHKKSGEAKEKARIRSVGKQTKKVKESPAITS